MVVVVPAPLEAQRETAVNAALEALEESLAQTLADEGIEASKGQVQALAQGVADWVRVMSGVEHERAAWTIDPIRVGPYWSRRTLEALSKMLRRPR